MSPTIKTALLLSGILLLAFVVCAIDLNGPSLFVDEFSEITLAKESTTAIIQANDSAPPLFPLALKAWTNIWQSDTSARWFSAACGLASILCVYGIGSRLVDNATGLAAAFITSLLPMHVYYSQFVRCYSLMFLLVALDLWLLLRATQLNRTRDWCTFALVAALGAYTHYYFAIFLATSLVIICLLRRHWWIGWPAIAAYIAIGIAMLPLLWLLPGDLEFQKGLRDPRPLNAATFGYTYFSLFNGYTLGPSSSELQTMSSTEAIRSAAPWLAIVGILIVILGYEGWRQIRNNKSFLEIATLAILPVLILGILSLVGGLNYNVRFVTWIMIAAAVWLGAGIAASWQRRHVQFAIAAFVVVASVAFINRHWVGRYEHENLRDAAAYLQAHATKGDTVYIVSDYLADLTRYYLGPDWDVVELPKPGSVNQIVRDEQDAAGCHQRHRQYNSRQTILDHLQPPLPRRPSRPATELHRHAPVDKSGNNPPRGHNLSRGPTTNRSEVRIVRRCRRCYADKSHSTNDCASNCPRTRERSAHKHLRLFATSAEKIFYFPPNRLRQAFVVFTSSAAPLSECDTNIAAIPCFSAHALPRSGPSTISGVSHPSASIHLSAATVTDASVCSTGRPVAGSMMCE